MSTVISWTRGSVASKFKYAIPGNTTTGVRARAHAAYNVPRELTGSVRPCVSVSLATVTMQHAGERCVRWKESTPLTSREHRKNPPRKRHERLCTPASRARAREELSGGPFHAAGDNWRHAVRLAAPAPIGAAELAAAANRGVAERAPGR